MNSSKSHKLSLEITINKSRKLSQYYKSQEALHKQPMENMSNLQRFVPTGSSKLRQEIISSSQLRSRRNQLALEVAVVLPS